MARQNLTQHFATEIPEMADVYLKLADYITHLDADQPGSAASFIQKLGLTADESGRMYDAAFTIWDEKQNRAVEDYLATIGTPQRAPGSSDFYVVYATEIPDQDTIRTIGGDLDWFVDVVDSRSFVVHQ